MILGCVAWCCLTAAGYGEGSDAPARVRPTLGAIRWDGWFRDNPWQRNLDPQQWHDRVPFYGKVVSENRVEVCGEGRSIMWRMLLLATCTGIAAAAQPVHALGGEAIPARILFSENFDDEGLLKRGTLDAESDRPNRNGIVLGRFDGRLVVDRNDAILRSTDFPKMKFNQLLMAPYFGPGLLPHAQKPWIDELTVGTQRIGPRSGHGRPSS
jgi:hypothetical protein